MFNPPHTGQLIFNGCLMRKPRSHAADDYEVEQEDEEMGIMIA